MEMNLPVIKLETRNLTKKFSATEGVADISLQVYEHELLTLLGPSGCGKTTILRAIGGFNKIDSGKILLDGAEVQGLPPEKRPTGMVFQSYNLWPHMTIYENMAFGLKLRKTPKKEMDAQIAEMLALVKMSGRKRNTPLSFPAASSSVWPLHAHWCSGPPYFCWTSRFRRWTPRSAARCARNSSASSARPG